MLIIGLMVIALICLAVGLALPSSAWLIASLIATAGAGYLVWKMRSAITPAAAPAGTSSAPSDGSDAAVDADATANASAETTTMPRVTDDAPAPARVSEDATQVIAAVAAGDVEDVWVIDGRPRFHLGNCPIIQGQEAEPIPLDQALEDGFMPCSLCEPTMAHTSH